MQVNFGAIILHENVTNIKSFDRHYNLFLQEKFGDPNGLKCHQYFHELEAPCPWCKNESVFKGETVVWYWHSEKVNRDYELIDLPINNEDGSISKLEIFKDITDLKHLKQEREKVLNLLEKVYESLDEAVFVVDPKSRKILSCNLAAQRIFGYPKDEMLGKNTQFLHVNSKKYREFGKKVLQALTSGTEFHVEYSLKRKDGTIFPTEHTIKTVRDLSGTPSVSVSVVRDLTFRKLAEEKLQNQQLEIKNRAQRLEELNATLKVLLDQREKENKELENQLSERINGLIIPTLKKLRETELSDIQSDHLDILEANIRETIKPFHPNFSNKMIHLSPTESIIADLIKLGYRTKEIASKMNISARTVEFHRNNIRKKMKIKGRKVNLKTYLSHLS